MTCPASYLDGARRERCLLARGHGPDHRSLHFEWRDELVLGELPVGDVTVVAGKARWSLMPWRALRAAVRVLEHGAVKHGEATWATLPYARRDHFDAAQRHLLAWWEGERLDHETGESHLAHAVCRVLFLLALETSPLGEAVAIPPEAR